MVAEPLALTLGTFYRRLTLLARDTAERVTCDLDLRFTSTTGEQRGIAEGCVLVEAKARREGGATDRLLWRMGERPLSDSKYCLGIGLLYPRVCINPYRQQLRRYFGWDSATPPLLENIHVG
ncbi:MAG: VTC domain-containing protein [Chloroflexota bacterium]